MYFYFAHLLVPWDSWRVMKSQPFIEHLHTQSLIRIYLSAIRSRGNLEVVPLFVLQHRTTLLGRWPGGGAFTIFVRLFFIQSGRSVLIYFDEPVKLYPVHWYLDTS